MSKGMSCKEAILWYCAQQPDNPKPEDLEVCEIFYMKPSIERMDPSISMLKNCKKLSISSNNIDKVANLNGLQLELLSIGRNVIKKLDGIEAVRETLVELWCSHNLIDRLAVLSNYQFPKLKKIYCACNNISQWGEIENLSKLESLEEVVFAGNNIPNYSP